MDDTISQDDQQPLPPHPPAPPPPPSDPEPDPAPPEPFDSAFQFTGTWREFAPIAFTNLLLMIVTLGVYRFWATARERRYLWSSTRFIDDRLEWTGTGLELFIGFVIAFFLIGLPLGGVGLLVQTSIFRGHEAIAGLITITVYILVFYMIGVARYRALRYRLSRTWWHGIRGGGEHQGVRYGWSYLWKTIVGNLPAGLLIPWSMCSLWNERWKDMSFGPHRFDADANFSNLMLRFVLCYILPFILFFALMIAAVAAAVAVMFSMRTDMDSGGEPPAIFFVIIVGAVLLGYLIMGIAMLGYLSKFYSVAVGATRLHTLEFGFTARTKDWLKLILGDIGLVLVTLGVGFVFLGYRHWKFFIVHMEAYGEINLDALTQSTTRVSRTGEGLLDAFDVGAI